MVGILRNPHSGRGRNEATWPETERKIREALGACEVVVEATTAPGSATAQARAMAKAGFDLLIVAGGDGTLSQAAEGLIGTETTLGVLPFGTGNDLARALGIGPEFDRALSALKNRNVVAIDAGRWRQGETTGHFINVAGTGFDAAVADRVNRGIRGLSGTAAYLAGVMSTLVGYRKSTFRLSVDGEAFEVRAMLVAIANATSYGGGMLVSPKSDLTDGLLDLVIVGDVGRSEFLLNFPKVMKGAHLAHPKVRHLPFRQLKIESHPQVGVLVDGELLPAAPIEVDVVPRALRVVTG